MTAYPKIVDATGFYPGLFPFTVTMMALYENQKIEGRTSGLTKFVPFKYEGGVCLYNPLVSAITLCAPVTEWNLKQIQFMDAIDLGAFYFGCVESDYCLDSGCPAGCSTSWVRASLLWDIPIRNYSSIAPNQPQNLTVTPGNGALIISWGAVTNIDVFAYYVEVKRGTTLIADGFTENTLRSVTIGNLQNGVTYNVRVFAVSHSAVAGAAATGTGTPEAPMKYKCTGSPNYQCIQAADGIYDTLAACQAACVAPGMKYKCTGSPNYQCIQAADGTYDTLAACQAACVAPGMKYKCTGSPDYKCVQAADGIYDTLAACQKACVKPIGAGTIVGISLLAAGIIGVIALARRR